MALFRRQALDAAQGRILIERLRLLYGNMDRSAIPMVPVATPLTEPFSL